MLYFQLNTNIDTLWESVIYKINDERLKLNEENDEITYSNNDSKKDDAPSIEENNVESDVESDGESDDIKETENEPKSPLDSPSSSVDNSPGLPRRGSAEKFKIEPMMV